MANAEGTSVSTGNETNEENTVNNLLNNLINNLFNNRQQQHYVVKSFCYKAVYAPVIERFAAYAKSLRLSFSDAVLLAIAEFCKNHQLFDAAVIESINNSINNSINKAINNAVSCQPVREQLEKPKPVAIKKTVDYSKMSDTELIEVYRKLKQSDNVTAVQLVAFELKKRGIDRRKI